MLPNGVLFENEEFEDDYLSVNLPVPLEYHYYSNGAPVNVTSETGYPEIVIDGTIVDQFSGLNSSGERTCSVDITQTKVFTTGLLQHQCGGVNDLIITPPVRPPEPIIPWESVRWEFVPSPGRYGLRRIIFNDGNFYGVGSAYTRVYITADGSSGTWHTVKTPSEMIFSASIVSVADVLIIPTFTNKVYTSVTNGVSWNEAVSQLITSPDFSSISSVVAREANGWALLSVKWIKTNGDESYQSFVTDDGVVFSPIDTDGNMATGFAYKDGFYYIPMSDGSVWSSINPTVWADNGTPFVVSNNFDESRVFRVIDGLFVASDDGKILTTTNPSLGWTVRDNSTPRAYVREILKVGGDYFAICLYGVYKRSSDLISWTDVPMPNGGVTHAAYGNDVILVTMLDGSMFALRNAT